MKTLATLDDAQRAAVIHESGPALVVAGPGAGKTRVLTERVRALVAADVNPSTIAVCTFSQRAAKEMAGRLAGVPVQISTIHGLAWGLLRETYQAMGQPVPDVLDKPNTFVREILGRPGREYAQGLNFLNTKRMTIGQGLAIADRAQDMLLLRLDAQDAARLRVQLERQCGEIPASNAEIAQFFDAYMTRLQTERKIDFTGMYARLYWMWQDEPLLKMMHARFDHLLVDEVQDTSAGQWEVLRGLVRGNGVYAVGDQNQGIYSWRGADPTLMQHFLEWYPDAAVYDLSTNYRSLPRIVSAGAALVGRDLQAVRKGDAKVVPLELPDCHAEGQAVRGLLEGWHERGRRWSEMAVLSRTAGHLGYVEAELITRQVPYRNLAGVSFFERVPVQDVLAYLALAANPFDAVALDRALRNPSRYLGAKAVEGIRRQAGRHGNLLDAAWAWSNEASLYAGQITAMGEWLALMNDLRQTADAGTQIAMVRDRTGYDQWYIDNRWRNEDGERPVRLQELDTLLGLAEVMTDPRELVGFAHQQAEPGPDSVTLSTIHRAKGLEWEAVIVAGCDDGHLPHRLALDDPEERRIAYVAFTRAKDELVCTWPMERDGLGRVTPRQPSRFLEEAGLL